MNKYILLFIFLFLLFSCYNEREEEVFSIYTIDDQNYPTKYCLLNEFELLELDNTIQLENEACFTVDSFGFILLDDYRQCNMYKSDFTNSDSILTFVKTIIANNQQVTGVVDTSLLEIDFFNSTDYINGKTNKWSIKFKNQYFKGTEIRETKIWSYVYDNGIIRLYGHWYPEVYIPPADKVSFEEAKKRLIGREFEYADWGGSKITCISKDDFYDYDSPKKIIYPFRFGDCIEMRVCWYISSKTIWDFFVDTTTGELVYNEQTIIF